MIVVARKETVNHVGMPSLVLDRRLANARRFAAVAGFAVALDQPAGEPGWATARTSQKKNGHWDE